MAIEGLMNHRGRVWRPAQSRGAYGTVEDTWTVVTEPARNNCEPPPISLDTNDAGPGEQRSGAVRRWYMTREADVAERDVVEVYEGPESPSYWRVLSVSFPRRHHYRLVMEPWKGELPAPPEPES
jgi:hypothetical protein